MLLFKNEMSIKVTIPDNGCLSSYSVIHSSTGDRNEAISISRKAWHHCVNDKLEVLLPGLSESGGKMKSQK